MTIGDILEGGFNRSRYFELVEFTLEKFYREGYNDFNERYFTLSNLLKAD